MSSGGNTVPARGTGDDGFDEEGYDESQRAEILEVTQAGPGRGQVLTDLAPDLGGTEDGDPDPWDIIADGDGVEDDDPDPDPDPDDDGDKGAERGPPGAINPDGVEDDDPA